MELSFEKDELLHALQTVQGVASGRNTLPILANVLIRAENGNIEFATTDLEVGIRFKVVGTIQEEGTITVSAKKLTDIVRELPGNTPINLVTTANYRVEITCGDGVYKIIGLSDEDFPQLPSADGEGVTIDGETLCSVIRKTEFAASTEEFRYLLNGLFFNLLENRTEVVAMDSHYLALAHGPILKTSDDVSGFIVPLKAVKEIARTFANSSEVKILLLKNQILFADDNATLMARLVEGEYDMRYQSLIPESYEGRAIVSKEAILRATRRVALLSNPKSFAISLEINPEQIRISTETPELGEAHETVAVESSTGNVRMGLDAHRLTEIFAHIETESLILEFSGEFSFLTIKPIGDDEHMCFIAPMRLASAPH
ncbi:DNA polymerase III subunit beta [Candidatus Poribacteria bacterium]|nr:DNA polymerase III subunit beta [Candidatus Poribacteria bacterium]